MPSGSPPTPRRIAAAALVALAVGIGVIVAIQGFSSSEPLALVEVVVVAVGALLVLATGVVAVARLAGWREPADDDFEAIVERAERLARDGLAPDPDDAAFLELDPWDDADFEALVREALDELPDLLVRALDHVAVVVRNGGRRRRAYGLYVGDGVARDDVPDRIVIFRDTLRRDFGHDPDLLCAQVTRTVRHELAHHLGADELGVRELGL